MKEQKERVLDSYGSFIDNYETYTEGGMESKIGRKQGLRALGHCAGKKILDFGCNTGINARLLTAQGAQVVGIDINEDVLQVARKCDPKGTYLHYNGTELAAALKREGHEKFDGVLASFSFCTINSKTLGRILKDTRQLLNPGGKLVIIEPNLEKALGTKYDDLHYYAQPGVRSGDFVHVTLGVGEQAVELHHDIYRRHTDYRSLLEEASFTITSMRQPRPWGWNMFRWWKAMLVPPFLIIVAE